MKIVVFTGGGISPSLNPTLYGVISEAQKLGWQVFGGLRGWHAMTQDGRLVEIREPLPEFIKKTGGTFLQSSRVNPIKDPTLFPEIKRRAEQERIDGIITIGGDDTIGAARQVYEKYSIPIIGVPKTVDNDLSATYWAPGFPTAANHYARYAWELKRDQVYTRRILVFLEVKGGKAGWLCSATVLGGADIVIPPEWPFGVQDIIERITALQNQGGLVAISDHARLGGCKYFKEEEKLGQDGLRMHQKPPVILRKELEDVIDNEVKIIVPANLCESGDPLKVDAKYSIELGQKAVQLLAAKKTGLMTVLKRKDGNIVVSSAPLQEVVGDGNYRTMPDEYFDQEKMLPTEKFYDYMKPIITERIVDQEYETFVESIKNIQ